MFLLSLLFPFVEQDLEAEKV